MSILNESYNLANGVEIPKLGLGTWFIDDDKAAAAVRAAVEMVCMTAWTPQQLEERHLR